MSNLIPKNNSKINNNIKSQSKITNYQEIKSLKDILKQEVREVKGQDYTEAYMRLLEKQYSKIIEDSINKNDTLMSNKNNKLFQKVLEKIKNKIIIRNKSQNELNLYNKDFSDSKILMTSKSSFNNSPTKKSTKKSSKIMDNSVNYSTYWEDYDFLKINKKKEINNIYIDKNSQKYLDDEENIIIELPEKTSLEGQTTDKITEKINDNKDINNKINNNSNINRVKKNKKNNINKNYLENYYLYLLNKRQKKIDYENDTTNEEKQNEKNNVKIIRKIYDYLYDEDEIIKKNLEDETIPEFYKRFIIQDEIRKDNLFENSFRINYNESQKLKGPKLSYGSRLICENILNYKPIYKRLDNIIKNKENDIDKIKKKVEKERKVISTFRNRKCSEKETNEWLKEMDNWNKKKLLKIQKKKEEIDKRNISCSECVFKPLINKNAHIKKEDEGTLFSDRLYLEYFTIRTKLEKMREKQQNLFTFRPKINKMNLYT